MLRLFLFLKSFLCLLWVMVMVICSSTVPLLTVYHYYNLTKLMKNTLIYLFTPVLTAFEKLLHYPIFQMAWLNCDQVCDLLRSLYYSKVSFQASDTKEMRHNFLLNWRVCFSFGPVPMPYLHRPVGFFSVPYFERRACIDFFPVVFSWDISNSH